MWLPHPDVAVFVDTRPESAFCRGFSGSPGTRALPHQGPGASGRDAGQAGHFCWVQGVDRKRGGWYSFVSYIYLYFLFICLYIFLFILFFCIYFCFFVGFKEWIGSVKVCTHFSAFIISLFGTFVGSKEWIGSVEVGIHFSALTIYLIIMKIDMHSMIGSFYSYFKHHGSL